MKPKRTLLELKHVEDVMRQDTLIGSDTARNGQNKRFTFCAWENTYRIILDGKEIDGGQAIEELLDVYNDL